jgi:hypothetical protein
VTRLPDTRHRDAKGTTRSCCYGGQESEKGKWRIGKPRESSATPETGPKLDYMLRVGRRKGKRYARGLLLELPRQARDKLRSAPLKSKTLPTFPTKGVGTRQKAAGKVAAT